MTCPPFSGSGSASTPFGVSGACFLKFFSRMVPCFAPPFRLVFNRLPVPNWLHLNLSLPSSSPFQVHTVYSLPWITAVCCVVFQRVLCPLHLLPGLVPRLAQAGHTLPGPSGAEPPELIQTDSEPIQTDSRPQPNWFSRFYDPSERIQTDSRPSELVQIDSAWDFLAKLRKDITLKVFF